MRTTLTLDDDVAARLRRRLEARDSTFKAVVNEALRRGLDALDAGPEPGKPYEIKPRDLGAPRVPSLDSISDVLAWAEGEDFK